MQIVEQLSAKRAELVGMCISLPLWDVHTAGALLEDREGNWTYKYEVENRVVDCVIAEGLSVGQCAYCSVKVYYHWINLQGRQCNVGLENTVFGGAE